VKAPFFHSLFSSENWLPVLAAYTTTPFSLLARSLIAALRSTVSAPRLAASQPSIEERASSACVRFTVAGRPLLHFPVKIVKRSRQRFTALPFYDKTFPPHWRG
jgi:hypothetical protein